MSAPRPWTQQVIDRSLAGLHRIKVNAPGHKSVDVTFFRDIPTQINSYSFGDPFGPASAEISFPQITMFDSPGGPGLEWLVPEANIEILWQEVTDPSDLGMTTDDLPDAKDTPLITLWEGYIVSLSYIGSEETTSVSVQCKGALFQVDNYKAWPEFPSRPIPYEVLIAQALDPGLRPALRTQKMQPIAWPAGWKTVVPDTSKDPLYQRPRGVRVGQKWTGLVTRNTGSWNAALTGQIQTLLALMFTPDGSQWTLMLDPGRKPVLKVRQIKFAPDAHTLEVWVGQPGVNLSLTEDWTQIANVYYGQGNDIGGTTFSNQVVSTDGTTTHYAPFASMRQVHPPNSATNRWFDPGVMRHETQVTFDNGLSPAASTAVALAQLARTSHPGYTGTITLKIDPMRDGDTLSKYRIASGMQILVRGFHSIPSGLLLHIAQVSVNVNDASVELTVDSKFRDLLTISQVRARARDALDPLRTMKLAVGAFSPLIEDLRKPWSYVAGSGVIPSSPSGQDPNGSTLFTRHASGSDTFPWTDLTRKYPPKKWPNHYIKIDPRSVTVGTGFDRNWSRTHDGYGIPCLFAEKGTIRLTQFAAYDEHGNVLPIRFHVSFYRASGINWQSMPILPGDPANPGYLPALRRHAGPPAGPLKVGEHYPFFPGAFEDTNRDGSPKQAGDLTSKQESFAIGWGNYYQPAGYYPRLYTDNKRAKPTGMLVDETTWSFDLTSDPNFQLNPNPRFPQNPNAGLLFVMIYAQPPDPKKPIYFLGRCFRQEPGTNQ